MNESWKDQIVCIATSNDASGGTRSEGGLSRKCGEKPATIAGKRLPVNDLRGIRRRWRRQKKARAVRLGLNPPLEEGGGDTAEARCLLPWTRLYCNFCRNAICGVAMREQMPPIACNVLFMLYIAAH
jgi:hypothetical protein